LLLVIRVVSTRRGAAIGLGLMEGTMPASARTTRPVEAPSRLQLAIMEWQRQLLEMKRQRTMSGRGLPFYGAGRP